jgi:hypothetical protein
MKRPAHLLRRVLTVLLAVTPLLASADLCTVGALTGRAELACPLESGGPACSAATAPAPKCPHCAPAAPVREVPRSHGPTCCDLRPQAADVAGQPVQGAPPSNAHPAAIPAAVAPDLVTASRVRSAGDDGRAPPGAPPPLHSPRAPPLG